MAQVIVPRGIPGAGKTTWVVEQMAQHPAGTAVRINNDDLSSSIWGRPWGDFFFSDVTRDTLRELRVRMLETFLKQPAITHIYIDNTNLAIQTVRDMQKVALYHGAEFVVDDQFLAVPVEECIARDALRAKPVGAEVIRKMWKNAEKLKPWAVPAQPQIEKYENNPSLPPAIIVDIDGTLAHMHDRSPYDWHRVGEDTVDENIKHIMELEASHGEVVVLSGRDGSCYETTQRWLVDNKIPFSHLYMRDAGDQRPDWITKHELFQQYIAGKYYVRYCLDDRSQVVNLWRHKLGLPTYQVAEGDF